MNFRTTSLLLTTIATLLTSLQGADVHVLPWDNAIAARDFSLLLGKKRQKIEDLHPFQRSKTMKVSLDGDTELRLEALDLPANEEGIHPSVTVKVPSGTKRPLILLVPNEESPINVEPIVIEDDPGDFRFGTFKIVNATGRNLVFNHAKKFVRVPHGWEPTIVDPGGDERKFAAKFFLPNNSEKPIYSSIWEYKPTLRQLVLLFPSEDQRRGPVGFKFIVEDERFIGKESDNTDES
jgi:hypothetical protein